MQLTIGKPVFFYSRTNELVQGIITAILGQNLIIVQAQDGTHRLNPFDLLLKEGNVLTEFHLPESD